MRLRHQQRGITFWGLMFVFGVFGFAGYIGVKLYGPYYDNFTIGNALKNVARQPDFRSMTRADIVTALEKQLFVIENMGRPDDPDPFRPNDYVVVKAVGQQKVVTIEYSKEVKLFGNISLLVYFEHEQKGGNSE